MELGVDEGIEVEVDEGKEPMGVEEVDLGLTSRSAIWLSTCPRFSAKKLG